MTGPGYDMLVGLHALSAIIGFGAVAVSGTVRGPGPGGRPRREATTAGRYFRPGTNWAERLLLLTPVLGAVCCGLGTPRPRRSHGRG